MPHPMASIITDKQQPDLLVVDSGPWDSYAHHDASATVQVYSDWLGVVRYKRHRIDFYLGSCA